MADPQWLTDTEQQTWRAYQAMSRDLERVLERDMLTCGLSMADFAVLVRLSEASQRCLRARDLGQQLGWDRSRLSHQIRRMEQRGIVTRQSCPTDARGTFIRLTDEGWSLVDKAAASHVAAVRATFFDALTEQDVRTLHELSTRIRAQLANTDTADRCPA